MNAIETNEWIDFNIIKEAVSMEQVLDWYGLTAALRRSNDGFRGACPIHGGHNPTQFSVSTDQNVWICFGDCACGGSVIDFVSRMEKFETARSSEVAPAVVWSASVYRRGPRQE